MSDHFLVTIIVPVYNVEKYLSRCVDSIISQTHKNLEILLINDGSIDNSGKICDEYSNIDNRIRVIHKKNGGVSSARNAGLDNANGDYVMFVDSDDWLELNIIESLVDIAKVSNSTLFQAGMIEIWDNGHIEDTKNIAQGVYNKEQLIMEWLNNKGSMYVWGKLFIRKLIADIRFDENIAVTEDSLFVINYLMKTKSIQIIEEKGYCYFQRSDSVMHQDFNVKHLDWIKSFSCYYEYFKNNEEILYYLQQMDLSLSWKHLINVLKFNKAIDKLPELRKRIILIDKKVINRLSWKRKLIIKGLKLFPRLTYEFLKRVY